MYRITDRGHTDAMIALEQRGSARAPDHRTGAVPAASTGCGTAWNVDRLYMARRRGPRPCTRRTESPEVSDHLRSGRRSRETRPLVIFGSSNWTSPSASGQVEHNMFTTKPDLVAWFIDQFNRKWNNTGGVIETKAFVPLPPDTPKNPEPANGATGVDHRRRSGGSAVHWRTSTTFRQSTTNASSRQSSRPDCARPRRATHPKKPESNAPAYALPLTLHPGHHVLLACCRQDDGADSESGSGMELHHRWHRRRRRRRPARRKSCSTPRGSGQRRQLAGRIADSTAAGGARIRNPNLGAAKIAAPAPTPRTTSSCRSTPRRAGLSPLGARQGRQQQLGERLGLRAVLPAAHAAAARAAWRIGTTSAADVNLEDCSGCGVSGWGWQDNGYGNNVAGTRPIYFASTGPQTMRVQAREDGLSIDQIVLSHTVYLTPAPGTAEERHHHPCCSPMAPARRRRHRRRHRRHAGDSALAAERHVSGAVERGSRRDCRGRLEAAAPRTRVAAKLATASPTRLPTSR